MADLVAAGSTGPEDAVGPCRGYGRSQQEYLFCACLYDGHAEYLLFVAGFCVAFGWGGGSHGGSFAARSMLPGNAYSGSLSSRDLTFAPSARKSAFIAGWPR